MDAFKWKLLPSKIYSCVSASPTNHQLNKSITYQSVIVEHNFHLEFLFLIHANLIDQVLISSGLGRVL